MSARIPFGRTFVLAFAATLFVACSSSTNEATATQAVAAVHAAIVKVGTSLDAVSPEARQHYADELTKLAKDNDALRGQIKDGDYASIEKQAKALLAQVEALGPQVAADKVKREQQLASDWTRLETTIPAALAAAQQATTTPAPDQAQRLSSFQDLWNQAVDAHKAGNVLKAVELGLAVERGLSGAAPSGG
ncbi:MAG: hypothetical protein U1F09_10530 [Steroidobacteraceae bacterium]